jgi:predicted DNA-binding protein with PD1-like motif
MSGIRFDAEGTISRVVAFKFQAGADLYDAIVELCEKHNIAGGVILSAFGSLKEAHIKDPIPMNNNRYGAGYGDEEVYEFPMELVATNGVICTREDGVIEPHIHVSLSAVNGWTAGGHLCKGTKTLITVEGAIAVFAGIDMKKVLDKERNIYIFKPEEIKEV